MAGSANTQSLLKLSPVRATIVNTCAYLNMFRLKVTDTVATGGRQRKCRLPGSRGVTDPTVFIGWRCHETREEFD